MKLAEALIQRADLQRENSQYKVRIIANAKSQEGDEPSEDVAELIAAYNKNMDKLKDLVIRINKTNALTPFDNVMLADKLAERDNLKSKINTFRDVYNFILQKPDRYSRSEIKYVYNVEARDIQKKIDSLSKELRELDLKIQAQNWTVDLLDLL